LGEEERYGKEEEGEKRKGRERDMRKGRGIWGGREGNVTEAGPGSCMW